MTKRTYRQAQQMKPLGAIGIEKLRIIAKDGYNKVNATACDSFTASAILAVHDRLTEANQAKLQGLPLHKAASVCFKLINGGAK
jgi:histidine ammonia-lyase